MVSLPYACSHCTASVSTLGDHCKHQRTHSGGKSFKFTCGFPSCGMHFITYKALDVHVSRDHRIYRYLAKPGRNRTPDQSDPPIHHLKLCTVVDCSERFLSEKALCHHVISHSRNGQLVQCPLRKECGTTTYYKEKSLYPHLSMYHRDWNRQVEPSHVPDRENLQPVSEERHSQENFAYYGGGSGSDSSSEHSSSLTFDEEEHQQKEALVNSVAKFYLKMETECLLPASTVQTMCEGISNLLEQSMEIRNRRLLKKLEELKVTEEEMRLVVHEVINSDSLYAVHNKIFGSGPWLCTTALRLSFYRENYMYSEPIELNLTPETPEKTPVFYVPIEESLKIMLACPTVQCQVDESFTRLPSQDNILEDYYDGLVYQRRKELSNEKSLDVFIFIDAFKPTNESSSAALRHSFLGVYFSLGNLKPNRRAQLDALQLLMLIPNYKRVFHDKDLWKLCFRRLIRDLKRLERNGMDYKELNVKVVLQFLIGDNLGQHEVGGFIGSFSAEYSCRFCPITKTRLNTDPCAREPYRTRAQYAADMQTCTALNAENPRVVHYKGVKSSNFECPFHLLENFHVCDPAMPPCIGHDLLSGIFEQDVPLLLQHFVSQNWFNFQLLNKLIHEFSYHGKDSSNEPTGVCSNTGLGGHAVQNWTLVRLLPFILQRARVCDPQNRHWQLLLTLREICEYVFAPSITLEQVAYLKALVENYLQERFAVLGFQKPKDHYLNHYADLMVLVGPLRHLWTMRFESLHHFFKSTAQICRNFRNPGLTMSKKHALYLAYMSAGQFFKEGVYDAKNPRLLRIENVANNEAKDILRAQNFSDSAKEVQSVWVDEYQFKIGQWLLLGNLDEINVHVGCIKLIVLDHESVILLLSTHIAYFHQDFGIYIIGNATVSQVCVKVKDLKNPCVQEVYDFGSQKGFALQHILSWDSDIYAGMQVL